MSETKPLRAQDALASFISTPLDDVLNRSQHGDPAAHALALFHQVVERVPAYRAFLAEQGVDTASVRTTDDFAQLPLVTKQNYVQRYPLPQLCRDGALETCDMIAVSSGSTGQPTAWPRFLADELAIARRFEQVFVDSFAADTRSTLAIVCFTLGTWVGGMYTASCCRYLASKGYPITVITPGNNKDEIFRVVETFGPLFEQVVLLGYPPALKDVIDTGIARGVAWERYDVKLVMAGEVFSEEWRSLVGERLGAGAPSYSSASLYGTADAGVLANETPLSITIRRFLANHPEAARELFGEARLPTLAQYDPFSRYFEVRDRTLFFSGDNGIPLIRYNILDTGGLVSYDEMMAFLARYNFDPLAELQQYGLRGVRRLPFVYVFGRSDFTVSFFGANIYPENVTVGLEQPHIREWVTGKFVLEVLEDDDRNRVLSVTVELAPNQQADAERTNLVAQSITAQLRRLNSEFAHYVPPERQVPQVTLLPHGDPSYFPIGVKHRYTRR